MRRCNTASFFKGALVSKQKHKEALDKEHREILIEFADKVPKTKNNLRVVHHDKETGFLLTTDKTRLFATKLVKAPKEGGTYCLYDFKEGKYTRLKDAYFPNWKPLLENKYDYRVGFTVPPIVSRFTKRHKILISFDIKEVKGKLSTKVYYGHTQSQGEHGINMANLKPWAGKLVVLHFSNFALDPILLTDDDNISSNPLHHSSFAIFVNEKKVEAGDGLQWTRAVEDPNQGKLPV
jgi:hypothetical protein